LIPIIITIITIAVAIRDKLRSNNGKMKEIEDGSVEVGVLLSPNNFAVE
jgi:hypothetical protein